jgi:hypothetical protein
MERIKTIPRNPFVVTLFFQIIMDERKGMTIAD